MLSDDLMRHIYIAFILFSLTLSANAVETEYLLTQQEFVQWEKAAKKVMDIVLTDYSNALSPKKRAYLMTEQRQWLNNVVKRCAKAKDFESRHECRAIAYGKRTRDLEERFVLELKKQHIDFSRPKFPLSLSGGDFQMAILENGKYSFSFTVYGGNGHECTGSGIAILNGSSFSRLPDSEEKQHEMYPGATQVDMPRIHELNNSCSLGITFSPHFVILSGNGYCHEYFACGMRTSVYGEFLRDDFHVPRKTIPNKVNPKQ